MKNCPNNKSGGGGGVEELHSLSFIERQNNFKDRVRRLQEQVDSILAQCIKIQAHLNLSTVNFIQSKYSKQPSLKCAAG